MSGLPAIVDIPLSINAYGSIRVSGTRVLLDVIIVACAAVSERDTGGCVPGNRALSDPYGRDRCLPVPTSDGRRPDCNPRSRSVNAARVECHPAYEKSKKLCRAGIS
jgi:hypothetical protein